MRKYIIIVLVCGLALPALAKKTVTNTEIVWSYLATGIETAEHIYYTSDGDKHQLFLARMARDSSAILDTTLAYGRANGSTETISNQADRYDDALSYYGNGEGDNFWGKRNDVKVAINGSFHDPATGIIEGGTIQSASHAKRFLTTTDYAAFMWLPDREPVLTGSLTYQSTQQFIYWPDGSPHYFENVNAGHSGDDLIVYTPEYGILTPTCEGASEVLVKLDSPAMLAWDNLVTGEVVTIYPDGGEMLIPFGHVVISGQGTAATEVQSLEVGDNIQIAQRIVDLDDGEADYSGTFCGIQGNHVLVLSGTADPYCDPELPNYPAGCLPDDERESRTAIAYDNFYIYFVLCDESMVTYKGMTLKELAVFLDTPSKQGGIATTYAVNLDGGGSSTMWVEGMGVVNEPDNLFGVERAVPNGIMMCNLKSVSESRVYRAGDILAVKNTWANVWTGPGTNYGLMGQIPYASTVTVLDDELNGILAKGVNWWRVDYLNLPCWIQESDLELVQLGDGMIYENPDEAHAWSGADYWYYTDDGYGGSYYEGYPTTIIPSGGYLSLEFIWYLNPAVTQEGYYDIFVWYPKEGSQYCAEAQYWLGDMNIGYGYKFEMNQTQGAGQWRYLASYYMVPYDPEDPHYYALILWDAVDWDINKYVQADAILVRPR